MKTYEQQTIIKEVEMSQVIISKLREMKLYGMSNAYQTSLEMKQPVTADELLNILVEAEWQERNNRMQSRKITQAQFRYQAHISELDFSADRKLDKLSIMRLADCSFIERGQNIIITGKTGAGKSYLASALGRQACLKGVNVMYANTTRLFSSLKMSKADHSYPQEIKQISKRQLLILDDFGLEPLDGESRLILLDILEDRHERFSTIITSQLPVSCWHEVIGEPTLADAILDRVVHASHRIEIEAKQSMRKKNLTV